MTIDLVAQLSSSRESFVHDLQAQVKPTYSASSTSQNIDLMQVVSSTILLIRKRITKAHIMKIGFLATRIIY